MPDEPEPEPEPVPVPKPTPKPATDAAAIAQLRDLMTPEVITIMLFAAAIFLFVVGTLLGWVASRIHPSALRTQIELTAHLLIGGACFCIMYAILKK